MPILLSHPISRFGYVFGKFIALFGSLSLVTWVPCLLLFAYQGYSSSPMPWAVSNLQIAVGLLGGIGDLDCVSLDPWTGALFVGEVAGQWPPA